MRILVAVGCCLVALAIALPAYAAQPAQKRKLDYTIDASAGEFERKVIAIAVKDAATGALLQMLDIKEPLQYRDEIDGSPFVDANFDGHEDIILFAESYAGPNTRSDVWLYNPKINRFEYHKALSEMTNVEVRAEEKTIMSSNSCCFGREYSVDTYTWDKGSLYAVRKEETKALYVTDADALKGCKEPVRWRTITYTAQIGQKLKKASTRYEMSCDD